MPKGKFIPYSPAEMAWLESNRLMVISDYHRAFCEQFARDDVSLANLHSLRKRKGWATGRTGCFAKGEVPYNKGKPHPSRGRSAENHFKKGERSGVAVKLWKPIGTERIAKDGYLERKIHDGMPLQSRWRAVHLVEWEALNGPLPEGHCLKCLGDKLNTSPSNWQCIPRALLPRLNGGNRYRDLVAFDSAPDELKPAILAVANLEHAARRVSA